MSVSCCEIVHCFLDVCGFIPQLNIQSPIGCPRTTVTVGAAASFSVAGSCEAAAGWGAQGMRVRRGVEDGKAFAAGVNNTTTARALLTLLRALHHGLAANTASCRERIDG